MKHDHWESKSKREKFLYCSSDVLLLKKKRIKSMSLERTFIKRKEIFILIFYTLRTISHFTLWTFLELRCADSSTQTSINFFFFISEQTDILVHQQTSNQADLKRAECFAVLYICVCMYVCVCVCVCVCIYIYIIH